MDIQELESFDSFQNINDTFTLFSSLIKKSNQGFDVKETFFVSEDNSIHPLDGKTDKDVEYLLNWFIDKKNELLTEIENCITKTNNNLEKFQSENPALKEEVRLRIKDLKKAKKFLEGLDFQEMNFEHLEKLKNGPEFDSDYAGISVKETKYFLI